MAGECNFKQIREFSTHIIWPVSFGRDKGKMAPLYSRINCSPCQNWRAYQALRQKCTARLQEDGLLPPSTLFLLLKDFEEPVVPRVRHMSETGLDVVDKQGSLTFLDHREFTHLGMWKQNHGVKAQYVNSQRMIHNSRHFLGGRPCLKFSVRPCSENSWPRAARPASSSGLTLGLWGFWRLWAFTVHLPWYQFT